MRIDEALRAHLLADGSIAALVTARIYPLRLPQKVTLPAVVLSKVSSVRFQTLRGQASLARPRFQVDSWAQTYDGAQVLGALCRQRLEGYVGQWTDSASPSTTIRVAIEFDSEMDLFEEDVQGGLARHSADYFVSHQTAGGVL